MTSFNERVLTTFRYSVSVFVDGRRETNIGDYLVAVKEEPVCLKLTSVISDKSQDLIDVLNGASRVTKVVIKRRDERDNVMLTSTYDIGELVRWETYASCQEGGVSSIRLNGRCSQGDLTKLEELARALESQNIVSEELKEVIDYLSKDNSVTFSLNGTMTDEDHNYGNRCSTVDLYFVVTSYKHKIGE